MTRLLNNDPTQRKFCLIKFEENGYPKSVLSSFTRKIGNYNINKITDKKAIKFLKNKETPDVDILLNPSFIKA
jgi:hypothetical protein